MGPIPKGGVVAVTGAAGFIGGWTVRLLLDKGYRVRACVRNADDEVRVGFLKAMAPYKSGRLTLWTADVDQSGAFDAVFAGAHGVAHIAHVSSYTDEAYMRRVCDSLIGSVEASGTVGRVVMTSSIAAIMSEADLQELVRRPVIFEDRWPDEHNARRTLDRQGYSIGKVMAERLFTEAAARHGGWDAVTVCPGDNVGPILSAHQKDMGPWQSLIRRMLEGVCVQTGAYRPWMTVDARDTAECHIRLLESTGVKNGERYMAVSGDKRNVEDICADIDRLLPELRHDTPAASDNFPDRIRAREAEMRAIWAGTELRNDRMRHATGITFRPLDTSIRDCVESLISVAGVTPKTRAAESTDSAGT